MTVFRCGQLYQARGIIADARLVVEDGEIREVGAWQSEDRADVDLSALAVIPAPVNGHLHSFQSLLRGIADDLPFSGWREALYRYTTRLTPDDVELLALFAYSEAAFRGTGTVCDFFYIHHGGNEFALRLAAAAERAGIRLVIARSMINSDRAPEAYREAPDQSAGNFRELRAALEGKPLVSAIPAPHSPHGASAEMVRAGAELAAEFDCPWHIHLAEAEYETTFTRERYGTTPLRWLSSLGVLDARCCLVHGVWLDREEVDIVAGSGAKLIHCSGSNMFLGDGIAPLDKYLDASVAVALGTDSGSANNHLSMFLEMRQASLLRRVASREQSALDAPAVFQMATANGAAITGLKVGSLERGFKADFVAVDTKALSFQPPGLLVNKLVFSLEQEAIREVYVAGSQVVSKGNLTWAGAEELPVRLEHLAKRLDLPT
ncbi:MAG TPA: amidohydrolase family protein [Dehalococcoidia bacterium]|nr:amidohydrolase family protein [Dehalococcoidia bacterium]